MKTNATALPEQHLSLDAVAAELDISPHTVRRMIARGELKAVRVGKRVIRVRRSDLERALQPVTKAGVSV